MKTSAVILALVISAGISRAEIHGTKTFKESLATVDSLSEGRVLLSEDESVKNLLGMEVKDAAKPVVKGHRVTIFFDNKQDSREKSEEAVKTFKENFPDVMIYTSYEIPYFRVMAGNCLNKDEAIVLMGRIKPIFPNAFIFNIDIPLEEFVKHLKEGETQLDSTAAIEVPVIREPK